MYQAGPWNGLASRLRRIRDVWAVRRDNRRMRAELERLLSAGDHLIEDIGLNSREVRKWLEREAKD